MPLDRIDIAILDCSAEGWQDTQCGTGREGRPVAVGLFTPARQSGEIGTIRGYHARLSNAALGHQMTAIVHISLSGQFEKTLSDFEAAIKRCPNVLSCHLMSGEYDYILRIAAKDLVDYERIHKEWLSAMPHVTKINSSFALSPRPICTEITRQGWFYRLCPAADHALGRAESQGESRHA
jgi:Lrp/AsnC family leucine-responsive transcriptional regulator